MIHLLLKKINNYLTGDITLQQLEGFLLSNLQGILESGDAAAIQTANHVDADIVELGENIIDKATFNKRLKTYVVSYGAVKL